MVRVHKKLKTVSGPIRQKMGLLDPSTLARNVVSLKGTTVSAS
jgi:hypothetical protein